MTSYVDTNPVAAAIAEFGYYTTSDGGMTVYDEHPPTIWDEEAFDLENLEEIEAAQNLVLPFHVGQRQPLVGGV